MVSKSLEVINKQKVNGIRVELEFQSINLFNLKLSRKISSVNTNFI